MPAAPAPMMATFCRESLLSAIMSYMLLSLLQTEWKYSPIDQPCHFIEESVCEGD